MDFLAGAGLERKFGSGAGTEVRGLWRRRRGPEVVPWEEVAAKNNATTHRATVETKAEAGRAAERADVAAKWDMTTVMKAA
jgi:hypothetical protein